MDHESLEGGFWGVQITKFWGQSSSISLNRLQNHNSKLPGFIVQPWPVSYPGF